MPDALLRLMNRPGTLGLSLVLALQVASYGSSLSNSFQYNQFNRDDAGTYLALGASLRDGRGYTTSLDPTTYVPHTHFPPGFPLLIAAGLLAGNGLLISQSLVAAAALANSILFWVLARRFLPVTLAVASTLLMVCSPVFDELATVLMSEQLTLFTVLLATLSYLNWAGGGYRLGLWAWAAWGGLAFGLLVRGLVLPLVPAFWMSTLFDRGRDNSARSRVIRATALLALAMAPLVAWEVRNSRTPATGFDGMRHIDYILRGGKLDVTGAVTGPRLTPSEFAGIVFRNSKWYVPHRVADAAAGFGWSIQRHLGVSLPAWLNLGILTGLAACLLRAMFGGGPERRLLALVIIFSTTMLVIVVDGGGARYWLQVTPFIAILAAATLSDSLDWTISRARWAASVPMASVALGVFALGVLGMDRASREPQYGAPWQDYVLACERAQDLTPPGAVLISHNPIEARWISGRRAAFTDLDRLALQGKTHATRPIFAVLPTSEARREHDRVVDLSNSSCRIIHIYKNRFYEIVYLDPKSSSE